MKKYLMSVYITLLICGLSVSVSCSNGSAPTREQDQAIAQKSLDASMIILRYDGCQYLYYENGRVDNRVVTITHKGNCDNPIHHVE